MGVEVARGMTLVRAVWPLWSDEQRCSWRVALVYAHALDAVELARKRVLGRRSRCE